MMRMIYAILFLVSVALYIYFADHISMIFLLILLILPICLFFINIYVTRKINVKVKIINKVISNNDKIKVQIHVDNPTLFPVLLSKISLQCHNNFSNEIETQTMIISIPPDNVTIIETTLTSNHCGKIQINASKLINYDLLGLTFIFKKLHISDTVSVLPSLYLIDDTIKVDSVQDIESHHYSTDKKGDDPSQVFDYHEYTQGDSIKNINWKLSSRLNTIMVKEFSQPISSSVLVLFEFAQMSETVDLQMVDTQLDVLMSVSNWLFEMQIVYQLEWYDAKNASTRSIINDSQENLYIVLEYVYEGTISNKPLTLDTFHQNMNNRKYSNIIYITSLLDETMLEKLYASAEDASVSVLLITQQGVECADNFKIMLQSHGINLWELTYETLQADLQNIVI